MSTTKTKARPRKFEELRKPIDASPSRRARVREHKTAMLAELRHALDLTQAAVADRLEVSQENVSQIERAETSVRLSTLNRYVEALGGKLEISARFPKQTVALKFGDEVIRRRRATKTTSGKAAAKGRVASSGKRAANSKRVDKPTSAHATTAERRAAS
jgi:transcriptional regulator with XRE-family HTH domain